MKTKAILTQAKRAGTAWLVASLPVLAALPTEAAGQVVTQQASGSTAAGQGSRQLQYARLSAASGESRFIVFYPTGLASAVADSVRAWENGQLGGTYEGSLSDTRALRAHYAAALSAIDEGNGELQTLQIAVSDETAGAVTLSSDSYFYGGGAHGVGSLTGATFRKADGARFGRELLAHFQDLQPLVARGLRGYFGADTDAEMLENLQTGSLEPPESIDEIPAPQTLPWVEGDSVVFHYQHYEIACYAAGQPEARLSIEEVWPWLPQQWRGALRGKAPAGSPARQAGEWAVGAQEVKKGAAEAADLADGPVFTAPEVMPSFNGSVNMWLSNHLQYPAAALENGIEGRVVVKFIVRTDGSLSDVRVSSGVDPVLDREALRVVKSMPRWNPGRQGGQPVNSWFSLPVTFRFHIGAQAGRQKSGKGSGARSICAPCFPCK